MCSYPPKYSYNCYSPCNRCCLIACYCCLFGLAVVVVAAAATAGGGGGGGGGGGSGGGPAPACGADVLYETTEAVIECCINSLYNLTLYLITYSLSRLRKQNPGPASRLYLSSRSLDRSPVWIRSPDMPRTHCHRRAGHCLNEHSSPSGSCNLKC